MPATTRRTLFLIVLLATATVSEADAQQDHSDDEARRPSAVLLGGFNLDLSGEADHAFTRVDPSLDFFVTPRLAVGARMLHETRYGDDVQYALWSGGPHTSFFPFETGKQWALGTTRPYAHGGLSYTRVDREQFGGTETYDGVSVYAGAGLVHTFVAGVGLFGEATLIGGKSYGAGNEVLELRLGLAVTP